MALIEEFEKDGNLLFRYRSYFPLLIFIVIVLAIFVDPNGMTDFNNLWWIVFSLIVSLTGFIIRSITIGTVPKGTSGKNTKRQIAQKLNTSGIYSVVRHPLYLGNFLMWVGPIIYSAQPWLIVITILIFALYYERIMFAEEMFLRKKYTDDYLSWSKNTPAFFPKLLKWRKSELDFSMKNVLKRESHSFINTILSFAAVNFVKNYFLNNEFQLDRLWMILILFSIVMFVVLLVIRKGTKWLDVKGR